MKKVETKYGIISIIFCRQLFIMMAIQIYGPNTDATEEVDQFSGQIQFEIDKVYCLWFALECQIWKY